MRTLFKAAFIFLLAFGGLTTVSSEVDAAQPYEYDFAENTTSQALNGINGVREMVITFDEDVTGTEASFFNQDPDASKIYILPGETDLSVSPVLARVDIIDTVTLDAGKKKLTIKFKNLEYLNYTVNENLDYKLIITKNALRFDQVSTYTLPFNIYDILPGFKSTFVETDASFINNKVFKNNAPRDVMIHVPKMYMTGIETIHRYDGLVDKISPEPSLSNIDILADEEATRLKVDFNNQSNNSRDLSRRTDDVEGFTMGQAGIAALICAENPNSGSDPNPCPDATAEEFNLKAFNTYGRFLEENSFKLRVNNLETDFIVDNYITASPDVFGQTYRLYDLMEDPTVMDEIMQHITEEDLDRIGVTYSLGSTTVVDVKDADTLKLALANPDITKIKLDKNGTFDENIIINRNVTIEAQDATFNKNVDIGTGSDVTVRINDATIEGALTINAGDNGTVILDNVTAGPPANANPSTTVVSGGSNSIHLNDFTSHGGIEMKNTNQVRLVTTGIIPALTVSGTGAVTLEGKYTEVTFKETAILNANSNTEIDSLIVAAGKQVTVAGIGWAINVADEFKNQVTLPKNENLPLIEWDLTGTYSANSAQWNNGRELSIITDKSPTLIPNTNWSIVEDTFEGKITGSYSQGSGTLTLYNLPDTTGEHKGKIVLQGINGSEIYKVTIPITVNNNQ